MTERMLKIRKTYTLSQSTLAAIKRLSMYDGCSQSEILAVAVHTLESYRRIFGALNQMAPGQTLVFDDLRITKDLGIYQDVVSECEDAMEKTAGRTTKRPIFALVEKVKGLLDGDYCTDEEREVFNKFIFWSRDRLDKLSR